MKIALIVPGGVDRSGTRRVVLRLLELIRRIARRHELHVFAMRQEPPPTEYDLLGARVHNVGGSSLFRRSRVFRAVRREHRRAPFDVLHAVRVDQGVVAAKAGRRLHRPVLLHLTGDDLASVRALGWGRLRTRRGRARLRRAVHGADRVTVPSRWTLAKAQRLEIAAEQLPWGVDLDRWSRRPPRPRDWNRPARLVHIADLSPIKDQQTLLRAAARLAEKGVEFRLDVFGVDTLDDELREMAGTLGLPRRVRFHGFVPRAELRRHVEHADLLLVSSLWEAGPGVVLEAAIAGVPTVGTDVGHVADWAPDAAVAVPVGADAALADAVAALLEDDERRLRIAAAAQERALAVDADATAERTLAIYEALADAADRPWADAARDGG